MRREEKRFETTGHPEIAYVEAGDPDAPPVILLAGYGGDAENWADVLPCLARGHRVLVPDYRGHGRSDPAPGRYLLEDFTGDIEVFVEQIAGGPVALAGHSLGGFVSAHLAATRPDLVSKAFLEDPPLLLDQVTLAAGARAAFEPLQVLLRDLRARRGTVDDLVAALSEPWAGLGMGDEEIRLRERILRRLAPGLLACDPEMFTPVIDGSLVTGYDPARPMACPVHLLRADPAVGPPPIGACFLPEWEEPFLAAHPHASVEFVPGAGHGIHLERPEWFVDTLEAFLGTE